MTYQDRLSAISMKCATLHRLYLDLEQERQIMVALGENTTQIVSKKAASIDAYFDLMLEHGEIVRHLISHNLTPEDEMDPRRVKS